MGNSGVQQEFEFVTFQILARLDDALLTSFHTLSTSVINTDCLEALAIPVHFTCTTEIEHECCNAFEGRYSKVGS